MRWIERALNLRPGDLGRGALLCACLFLIITSYVVGKVAGDALFLAHFNARQLAYADIASAFVVALVISAYVRFGRKLSVVKLLVGSMLFFASNCILFWFWALSHAYRAAWLYPAFYIWVKTFGVLAPAQIWTLANYVLTTREAKRVFGLIGGGAISGWIFAGLFSRTIAKVFGTESLLVGMAFFLVLCAVLIVFIWRSGRMRLGEDSLASSTDLQDRPRSLRESMRVVFASPYLRVIAAVICVSNLVTNLTMWQFRAIAQQVLVHKDALAVFFGEFNVYAGIASLVFQLLLTTRLLRRFGIGKALFVLPLAVLAGSMGLLIVGSLAAVVALKGTDQVLRYSVDKSTAELLYLPLPSRLKTEVKWFIDTVIWRAGDTLAGLTVLICATWLHFTPVMLSWVVFGWISCWLLAVVAARRQYVLSLKEGISRHRLEVEQLSAPVLDRETSDLLAGSLNASDPADVLYALQVFETERRRAIHPAIRSLLRHPAAMVREKALGILSASADTAVLPEVKDLIRDTDLTVRTEALLFLSRHTKIDPLSCIEEVGDFADFSVRSAMVAYLARPGETQNLDAARRMLEAMVNEPGPENQRTRLEAARLLGRLPDCFDPLLATLLTDADTEVTREAIRSAGLLRKRRLLPDLLDRLANPALAADAQEALASFGDVIVGALGDYLSDPAVSTEVRRGIPAVLARTGTPAAARTLVENLLQSDTRLRFHVISALNKLHAQHPEIEPDVPLLETILLAEILGHYRSYQILHALESSQERHLVDVLKEAMEQELERIFRLLGLLYPRVDAHGAYVGLQSKSASVHDNALEFLDNVLKVQLRDLLVPLLDGRITVSERARKANRLVRVAMDNPEQAILALISSQDPWLRSCGAYAIGSLGLKSLEEHLNPFLDHPDALLRETARAAKLRLGPQSRSAKA
ncbi:MAG TPA: Npt1/Npt2 family nucleotide transporter [Terriglobales bacterium]|nr:Npt1/Npt2 family nucleotide transporter [Terriglobales bacterium]